MSGLALGPTQPPVKWALELFPRVKRPGREVNHPLPFTAEIKNEWSCTSLHPICLHSIERENVTFTVSINLNGFCTTNAIAKAASKYGSARCQCLQTALSGRSILRLLVRYQHYCLQGFDTVYYSTCLLRSRGNRCLHILPDANDNRFFRNVVTQ